MKKFNYGFEDFSFSENKSNHQTEVRLLIKQLSGFKDVIPYLNVGVNMLYRIVVLEGYLMRFLIFIDKDDDLSDNVKYAIGLCKDMYKLLLNNSNVYTYQDFFNENKTISNILFEKANFIDGKSVGEAQLILGMNDIDMRKFINKFQTRGLIRIDKITDKDIVILDNDIIVLLDSFYSYMYLIENMNKKEINNGSFSLETANSISIENEDENDD